MFDIQFKSCRRLKMSSLLVEIIFDSFSFVEMDTNHSTYKNLITHSSSIHRCLKFTIFLQHSASSLFFSEVSDIKKLLIIFALLLGWPTTTEMFHSLSIFPHETIKRFFLLEIFQTHFSSPHRQYNNFHHESSGINLSAKNFGRVSQADKF